MEYRLVNSSQHVRCGGYACTVKSPVVVFASERDILLLFKASFKKQRKIGGGNHIQVPAFFQNPPHLCKDLLPDGCFQFFHGVQLLKLLMQNFVHNIGKRQRSDVNNIHSLAGNNELPACSHHIGPCILFFISQCHKAGDRHVVIFILRESQPQLRQSCALLVYREGRFAVHTQIDFGVNQPQFARCFQAPLGENIEAVSAVRQHSAQHYALAVVTLLHAWVQITVPVAA